MNSETITLLVKFLPTLLVLVLILWSTLKGFQRGFRKSLIFLIHYIISLVAGLVVYFSATKVMLSDNLNDILASINPSFSEANSLYDVIEVLLGTVIPDYAGMISNPYIEQTIMAFVGLGVSLVLGIVCLMLLPLIVRFVLYILYLLFYREGKIKNAKLAEGLDYNPHRLLGMAVGVVRGALWSLLMVSFLSSAYFVLSGGITATTQTSTDNILLLESLSKSTGVDVNAIYKGLKESRSTGLGKVFDFIKIEGTPIDLYYADLFLSSNVQTYEKSTNEQTIYTASAEAVKAEIVKLSVREELALLVGLLESVLESNAITIQNGEADINYNILISALDEEVSYYVNNSVILSEITPLAIIGIAESIADGTLQVDENISQLFTEDLIEEIKQVNIVTDLAKIISVAISACDLVPIDPNTQTFDFGAFANIETYFNLNTDPEKGTTVQQVFTELSEIETLTKVLFPVGIGMALDSMSETINSAGINPSQLNFEEIDWQDEIANIGLIYEKVVDLNLDINKIMDSSKESETALPNNLKYIIELCTNSELVEGVEKSEIFKGDLIELVDTIFSSELFGQVGLVFIKSQIAGLEIKSEDDSSTPLNDALSLVKENLNYYEVEDLRNDLSILISSCLDATNLLPVFMNGFGDNYFELLYSLEIDSLRSALIGEKDSEGNYVGGLYSLSLLTGKFNENANYAIDALLEGALKTYAGEIFSEADINAITSVEINGQLVKLKPTDEGYNFDAWPNELGALLDAICDLQTVPNLDKIDLGAAASGNIGSILPPEMGEEEIDIITAAASDSMLLSGLIEGKLVSLLTSNEMIGDAASDPSIVWMDTVEVSSDNTVTYKRGELNSLLKAFIIFTDADKGIDLNNTNSLINGIAQLIHPATSKERQVKDELDYSEVVILANSQVLMSLLGNVISGLEMGDTFQIVVPYYLNSTVNSSNWKNWATDANADAKNGEFANVVTVLYNARAYVLEKDYDGEEPEDRSVVVLTVDNLISSMLSMEKDESITNSKVFHATLSKVLIDLTGGDTSIIKVRKEAIEDNSLLNPVEPVEEEKYKTIKAVEIQKLLVAARNMGLDLGNLGSIAPETVLSAIIPTDKDDIDAVNRARETRKSICESNILNITAMTKIAENEMIHVPNGYYNNDGSTIDYDNDLLYPSETVSWQDCELNKMIESVIELDVVDENGSFTIPTDPIAFLNTLDETKISKVYESKIFHFTLSVYALNNVKFNRGKGNAYDVDDDVKKNKFVYEREFKLILNFLKEAKISSLDDINRLTSDAGVIIDLISNENIIEMISESNILNINVVNVIQTMPLSFADAYLNGDGNVDIYAEKWYPARNAEGEVIFDDSEVYNLLTNVAAFKLEYKDGKLEGLDANLLNKFMAEGDNEPEMTVSQVYTSDTLALTLTREISAIVKARKNAYVGMDEDKEFKESELQALIDFFSVTGLKPNQTEELGSKISIILDAIKNDAARQIITTSNILNINVVENVASNNSLSIPTALKDTNAAGWYQQEGADWKDCEVAKLLNSIAELGLDVKRDSDGKPILENGSEVIDTPTPELLLSKVIPAEGTNEADSDLEVIYASDVLALTMTVEMNKLVEARSQAYDKNRNDSFYYEEVELLIDFFESTNLKASEINNLGSKISILLNAIKTNDDTKRIITKSNILNINVVKNIATENSPLSIPSDLENINADGWYPQTSEWGKCELARLLESIAELGLDVKRDNNGNPIIENGSEVIDTPTPELLLSKVIPTEGASEAESDLEVIYASDVLALTMTVEMNKLVEARQQAYDSNRNDSFYYEEIKLLIDFFDIAGMDASSINSLGSSISNFLGVINNEDAKAIITTSNILNINVVKNIATNKSLSIPSDLENINADGWYPQTSEWGNCELARLLESINVLGCVKKEENGENVISVPLADEMLHTFADSAVLNTVYDSKVLALTITREVYSVDEIYARDEAFENYKSVDKMFDNEGLPLIPFTLHEIELLVEFVNLTGVNVSEHGLDAEHIFGSDSSAGFLHNEDKNPNDETETIGDAAIRMIVHSNILNASLIHNICFADVNENKVFTFPEAYYENQDINTGKLDPNFDYWYHDPEITGYDKWKNGELYHLLVSLKMLNIKASSNNLNFDVEIILDSILGELTEELRGKFAKYITSDDDRILDVVYRSDVIAKSVSDRIDALTIPAYVYGTGETMFAVNNHRHIKDEIVREDQVEYLLIALEKLGLSFSGKTSSQNEGGTQQSGSLDSEHITDISLQDMIANIDDIMNSSILHYIISSKLINTRNQDKGIVVEEYYTDASTSKDSVTIYPNTDMNGSEKRYIYVNDDEIRSAFEILDAMGVENISGLAEMKELNVLIGYLSEVRKYLSNPSNAGKGTVSEFVTRSAIINKILSSIFIQTAIGNNPDYTLTLIISTNPFTTENITFTTIEVNAMLDSKSTEKSEIITVADLQEIISKLPQM